MCLSLRKSQTESLHSGDLTSETVWTCVLDFKTGIQWKPVGANTAYWEVQVFKLVDDSLWDAETANHFKKTKQTNRVSLSWTHLHNFNPRTPQIVYVYIYTVLQHYILHNFLEFDDFVLAGDTVMQTSISGFKSPGLFLSWVYNEFTKDKQSSYKVHGSMQKRKVRQKICWFWLTWPYFAVKPQTWRWFSRLALHQWLSPWLFSLPENYIHIQVTWVPKNPTETKLSAKSESPTANPPFPSATASTS